MPVHLKHWTYDSSFYRSVELQAPQAFRLMNKKTQRDLMTHYQPIQSKR